MTYAIQQTSYPNGDRKPQDYAAANGSHPDPRRALRFATREQAEAELERRYPEPGRRCFEVVEFPDVGGG